VTQQTVLQKPFVVGSKSPKRRKYNSPFNRKTPVYAHELERTDPMMDLYEQWAQRMPE
jgi:hypothetical protein